MMEKFRGKYRISSNRMPRWDYAGNGAYFITLVTQNRECNLGHIENGVMILSDFGKIVETEWLKSFDMRNELFLDEYVIMPNHLHAIVIIDNTNDVAAETTNDDQRSGHHSHSVGGGSGGGFVGDDGGGGGGGGGGAAPPRDGTIPNPPIPPRKPKSISSFVGGFKSAVNSKIDDYIDENHLDIPKYNRQNHFFQPNYHDRVIRNHNEYLRIKNYIINNPKNWDNDTFSKEK